jgi:hypothetical protein
MVKLTSILSDDLHLTVLADQAEILIRVVYSIVWSIKQLERLFLKANFNRKDLLKHALRLC